MTINLFNIDYTQFIRQNDGQNLENKDIIFEIKDIRLILISGKHYFYIEDYGILKHEIYELKENFIFHSLKEIKDDVNLFTIKLKAKEIYEDLINTNFVFQDLYGNEVKIDNNEDYEFENGKIYFFNGYSYNKSEQKLKSTMISKLQKYSNNKNELYSFKDILQFKKDKLVNFKCKVKSFSLTDKYVMVEDSDKKIYKVYLNYNLLKKISLNGICFFYNFLKINDDEFNMTNFSDIDFEEETSLEFYFNDFVADNNFYNRISINKKHYNIDKKIMNIKLQDSYRNNLFIQDIYYERIGKEKITSSCKFSMEVNKGKKKSLW